ncbi:putative tenascin-X isoform X1 [Diplonema papillatum]|nr:putative tenascin-X isoform X1 [Diplonema papillatum]
MCGQGNAGQGMWHNCFVHDACVWARCTDDNLIPEGVRVLNDAAGVDDEFCGQAFGNARVDWIFANALPSCLADASCPTGTNCIMGACMQIAQPEGSTCTVDTDCTGYCQVLQCWDGSSGDKCGKDSDCASGLTFYGPQGLGRCQAGLSEGGLCGADLDCLGYCEKLRCWDGSTGDSCGSNSDCQSGECKKGCLFCIKRCA